MAFNAVRSVQKIQISMASAATSGTATITPVTTANCMILVQGNKSNANSTTLFALSEAIVTLTNSTTVTAARGTGTSFTCVVNATIIEFWPAFVNSIQTGSIAISAGGTSNTATITTVGANAFVILTGISNAAASSTYSQAAATIALTNTTTVTAATIPTVGLALTVGYMVVDLTSAVIASVQAMSHTVATTATSYTDTITSVTQGNTWIAYGGVLAAASTSNAVVAHTIVLTNATTVTMQRGTNTATSRTINYTVVSFQTGVLASSVQRNTIAIASANSGTATITTVNPNYAVANWLGYKIGSGSNPNAASASAVLTDNVTVTAAVTGSTPVTETVSFEVLEFTPTPINFKPKPAGRMRINDADPYGKAVMWAALPGSEVRELRTGACGVFVGTGVTEVMTPFGPAVAVATAGANGIKYANSISYMAARIGTNFSMVAIGKVLPASASNGKIFCSPVSDAVWNDPWNDLNMQLNSFPGWAGSAMGVDWATGGTAGSLQFPITPVGIVSPTDYHVWAVTWDGTTERSYQDGVLIGSWGMTNGGIVASKPVFTLDLAYLFLTSVNHTTESISGTLGGVYVMDGTLSAQDVSVLAADPWRPFVSASSYFPIPIEFLVVGPTGSASPSINLTGVSASGGVTAPTVGLTQNLTLIGVSASGAITAPTVGLTQNKTLTGVSATGGITAPTIGLTQNLTLVGVSASGAITAPAVGLTQNKTLTGVSATGGITAPSVGLTQNLTLVGVSASGGITAPSITTGKSINLTGVGAIGGITAPTVGLTQNKTLTGVSAIGGITAPTVGRTQNLTLIGVSAIGGITAPVVGLTQNKTLTGVSAIGGITAPTIGFSQNISLTGVSATGGITAPTVGLTQNKTLTGVSATGGITAPTIGLTQNLTLIGVSATGSVSAPTVGLTQNLTLTGVSASGSVGTLRAAKQIALAATFDALLAQTKTRQSTYDALLLAHLTKTTGFDAVLVPYEIAGLRNTIFIRRR